PQVKQELSNIQPKISYLLLILKNKYVLKGKSLKEGYNEFLSDFENQNDKDEFLHFSNIINFLDNKKVSESDIEKFSGAMLQEIGRFIARDIPIRPTDEDCRVNKDEIKRYKEYLKNKYLVLDKEDIWLIAELMLLAASDKKEIHFSTDNLDDFNYEQKEWSNNPHLKKIHVYSSNDFFNQFISD
ncbi:MAG: hypothetical protein U9P44_00985, partial [archaeon]|nr:hypothetical protein [archaeon]